MKTDTKRIEATFSRASQTYDSFARMQKKATELLLEQITENLISLPSGPVLELGCGTGQMSSRIDQLFGFRKLILSDIAPGMVARCKEKISKGVNSSNELYFKVLDAEEISDNSVYAAVLSGLTVQWFNNFNGTLRRIYSALLPGGKFIFSCLVRGSFPEWVSVCNKMSLPCTANVLPDSKNIYRSVSTVFGSVEAVSRTIEVAYPSAAYFFNSLKRTGTNIQIDGKSLTAGQMRRLIKFWDKSLNGEKLTMNYVVDILTATKQI